MDGQSRQLGYAVDSQYYRIDNFAEYVREGLNKLTLDDVNRVIKENLSTDNVQYVFVSKDTKDLRDRLVSNRASPISYDADKPQKLLDEDKLISTVPLGLSKDKVSIVSSDDVFN
jgi:zinc protease